MMVSDYIRPQVLKFVDTVDKGFDDIYKLIENPDKNTSRNLLIYADKLLNEVLNPDAKGLRYFHFHFEGVNYGVINLLAEFVVIKLFFYGLHRDTNGGGIVNNKIKELQTNVISAPMGLSGKSAEWKKMLAKQKYLRKRKSFYEEVLKMNSQASLLPNTIVNALQKESDHIQRAFEVIPFGIPIEMFGKDSSYVLLNTEKRKNSIDKIEISKGNYLLDHIENIIIFDCEQKQLHRDFNYIDLNKWNIEYASSFRNLFVFSFSETDFTFNKLMTRIERVQSRFYLPPKYPNYKTYSVLPDEIDILLGRMLKPDTKIQFLGDSICSFWKNFKDIIGFYEGLYELRSLKMMNIYSLVINEKLKEYVLTDLFSTTGGSKLLTEETTRTLLELSEDTIAELRSNLSNTLGMVINSRIVETVQSTLKKDSILILPEIVYNNKFLKSEIIDQLILYKGNRIESWNSINVITTNSVVVLDYRDLGKFPYTISPNLFERSLVNSERVTGVFLSFFFQNRWSWTNYKYTRDLAKVLNNSIRIAHFDWDNFNHKNQHTYLEKEESFDWDFESILQNDYEQDSIKVRYCNSRKSRVFHPAELFILTSGDTSSLRVMHLVDIEPPTDDRALKMQQLDEMYSELNLYEKLADVEREERELQIIRDKYDIAKNDTAGRLWKTLLKRKSDEKGKEYVYEELRSFLSSKGVGFVSLNTFEKHWMNPESNSLITRGKKIFFHLCEYLGLEKTYVGIMLRIKNAEVQASRSNNKQMNNLLADLINDGCFNDGIDLRTILSPLKDKYIRRHDFEQIAVEESKVIDTLITLVELLKPEVLLEPIERIERI